MEIKQNYSTGASALTLWVIVCALFVLSGPAACGASARQQLGQFKEQTDVGVTPKAGSASYDAARHEYTVTGGGENMWADKDAFHFVWRRWKGDVTLTADIAITTTSGSPHRKAALMIRQGLGPGDAYADAALHGVGLTALQYRQKEGATTLEAISPVSSPQSLRLERRGNTFTLFVAGADGQFKKVGSATVELHDPVYVGLAVCAHDANALTTAAFRNVKISKTAQDESN
ncbi:MAG: hypothetical protein ACRD1I_05015 [Terriglobia bacterium]